MRFIVEQGYDLREGTAAAFKAWLLEHEDEIAKECPTGIEYLGTFVAAYVDQRDAGGYRTLFHLDSFGAQDRFEEALTGDSRFGELLRELLAFGDWKYANYSQQLLKPAADMAAWEPTNE